MRQTVAATRGTATPATQVLSRTCACGNHTGGGQCDHCGSQQYTRAALIPPGGAPLTTGVREQMESRFDTRFDTVRVHRGVEADRSARQVNADAFTVGSNIVLGSSAQDFASPAGERLLAHELTHVAQQRSAPAAATLAVAPSASPFELQARASAANVVAGGEAGAIQAAPVQSIQRQELATAAPQQRIGGAARALGDQRVGPAQSQLALAPPASEAEALTRLKHALTTIQNQLSFAKNRRDEQEKINNDQWIVAGVSETVGSVVNVFKGKRSVNLPTSAIWVRADTLSARASERIASRDVIGGARFVQELAAEYKNVALELNEYLEGVIGGAEIATTGLQATAVAGAIAATIATGGAAAAAGAGLFGTSVAVGAGAGVYGAVQEEYGQVGEIIAGTRKELDLKAIALRGGKDAIMGFVGTLAGGALSKYAVNYFGRILMQRLKPEQVALVAERLGVDASKLTPAVFLSKGQTFVIDFFSGVGTAPLMAAVQAVLTKLEGKETPTGEEFWKQVIDDAITGGIIQLFLGALMHGASGLGKSKPSGAKGTRSQTQQRGKEVVPPGDPARPPVREQQTPQPIESLSPSEPLQSQTPIETPAVETAPAVIEPTPTAGVETPIAAQQTLAAETVTAKPLSKKPPAGEDTASVFAELKAELKTIPEGKGPVVGQRIKVPEKPVAQPEAPAPKYTLEQRVASAQLERDMLMKRRAQTIDSLKNHRKLQKVVKKSKKTFGDPQTTLVDLLADPHSLLPGGTVKKGDEQSLRQLYDYWKTEKNAGRLKSRTFESYLKYRMKQWRGGEGEVRNAFDIGPQEILVKAPKPNSNAPGSDTMTYLKDIDRIRYKDNKAYAKGEVTSVSALEQNILKNLQDDIVLIEKSVREGPRAQENVPPEIAQKVLPRLKDAAKELKEYIRRNIDQTRSPAQQKYQFKSAEHQQAVDAILRNNKIERVVTTEGGGRSVSLSSKLVSEGFEKRSQ